MKTLETTKTFGQLTQGTVVNYSNMTMADDTNFVVLRQYEDRFGAWTEVLSLDTFEKDCYMQHNKIDGMWSIVKEN